VGGVAGYLLLQRAGIGVNPSPGSSATQPASMASQPLASEATLIPSPSNQPSESPRPRDGWTAVVVAEDNPYATVVDVYDAGDILVAFGQADRDLLGVWLSTDGSSWTAADSSPVPPDGYGGRIVDVLHPSGGGLLALAELGLPEGSEPLGTAMYASQDGNEWRPVGDVPAGVRLAALATDGDLLFAGGSSGIWYSDDSGATWLQSADAEALGGQVVDIGSTTAACWRLASAGRSRHRPRSCGRQSMTGRRGSARPSGRAEPRRMSLPLRMVRRSSSGRSRRTRSPGAWTPASGAPRCSAPAVCAMLPPHHRASWAWPSRTTVTSRM